MMESAVNMEECLRKLTEIAQEIQCIQQQSSPITAEEVVVQLAQVVDVLKEIHRPVGIGLC